LLMGAASPPRTPFAPVRPLVLRSGRAAYRRDARKKYRSCAAAATNPAT
jgi:hypothetical protein